MPLLLLIATFLGALPIIALIGALILIFEKRRLLWRYARPKLRLLLLTCEVAFSDPVRRRSYILLQPIAALATLVAAIGGAAAGNAVFDVATQPDVASVIALGPFPVTWQSCSVIVATEVVIGWLFVRYVGHIRRAL